MASIGPSERLSPTDNHGLQFYKSLSLSVINLSYGVPIHSETYPIYSRHWIFLCTAVPLIQNQLHVSVLCVLETTLQWLFIKLYPNALLVGGYVTRHGQLTNSLYIYLQSLF